MAKGSTGADADLDPTQKLERSPEPPDNPEDPHALTAPVRRALAPFDAFGETAEAEPLAEPAAAGSDEPPEPEPTPGRIPRWRRRAVALSVGVCVLLGLGGWLIAQGIGHGTHHAGGAPTQSAQTSASTPANATAGASASPAATYDGGPVLTGPGCPASPFATFAVTAPGSLETDVGGGDPACGQHADAFRKSGSAAGGGSSAVWSFSFRRSVTCALSIFIADTDPSSGQAVYKLAAGGTTTTIEVNQAAERGKNTSLAAPGAQVDVPAADGNITLTLTDISVNGDTNHVTASSVTATCRVA